LARPVVPLVKRMTAGSSSATVSWGSSVARWPRLSRGMSSSVDSTGTATSPSKARRGASAITSFGVHWAIPSATSRADHSEFIPTTMAPSAVVAQTP